MFGRFFLTALASATLLLQAACTCGTGPYEGDYFDGDRPDPIANVKFSESEKGDPKVLGCADGQREAFADVKANPRIAGCMAKWTEGKSLRDAPTGKACGDDGEACAVPADACAEGWHVCGNTGDPKDLRDRANANACNNAGPGRFNAALSHSPTDEIDPCPTITASTKLPCVQAGLGSEPVCCGNDCGQGKCRDGVWKGKTKISMGTSEGCGAVTADRNGGVLCCADGTAVPAADGDAKAAEGSAEAGEGDAEAAGDGAAAGDDAAAGGDAKAGDVKAAGDPPKGDGKAGSESDAKAGDTKAN